MSLELRSRERDPSSYDASWEPRVVQARWQANETAVVVIDMWNSHWCRSMAKRGLDLAFRVNRTVSLLRARGVHVLHSPSPPALAFYDGTAARQRVVAAPRLAPPGPVNTTDPAPPPLSTPPPHFGCSSGDVNPGGKSPTFRQTALITIDEKVDGILDSDDGAEAYSYLQHLGVRHLLYVGAASNMCVTHRQDAVLNMQSWAYDTVVVRDEVDAMYSPLDAPYVSHDAANALQIGYIESFLCPTIASGDIDFSLQNSDIDFSLQNSDNEAPSPPPTTSSTDCSLNGDFKADGSGCACDPGWTGSECQHLDVHKTRIIYPNQPQTVPGRSPAPTFNAAAWGGSMARDEATGIYHLFSDVVCQDWSPGFHELNANIQHSTSRSPLGPWTPAGFVVGPAVDGFTSINPRILRDPASGAYLLFHVAISSAQFNNPAVPSNCSGARVAPLTHAQRRGLRSQGSASHTTSKLKCGVNQTMRVAVSETLDGPWELVYFKGRNSSYYPGGIELPWSEEYNCNVNNPAGWVQLENNSLVMCYEATVAQPSTGTNPQATGFIISDSGNWRGPWREVTPGVMPVGYPTGRQGNAEDPFFWRSKRGFHVLFHEFNNPKGSGGYAYSRDAVSWTTVDDIAFNMSLSFTQELPSPFNGTNVPQCRTNGGDSGYGNAAGCIQRRERPELVFAFPPNNTHRYSERPLFLLNGVQAQCEGVPACEAIYGKCKAGEEEGRCAETISVTVATGLGGGARK